MKKTILIIILSAMFGILKAQDTIYMKTGTVINAKVFEINKDEVRYKKANNSDGPVYSLEKNEITLIQYQNGTKDVFVTNSTQVQKSEIPNDKIIHDYKEAYPTNNQTNQTQINYSGYPGYQVPVQTIPVQPVVVEPYVYPYTAPLILGYLLYYNYGKAYYNTGCYYNGSHYNHLYWRGGYSNFYNGGQYNYYHNNVYSNQYSGGYNGGCGNWPRGHHRH